MRRQKLTRMYFFIFHLSLADLAVAFFTVLPQMIWDITFRFQGNDLVCKAVKFLQVFAMYLSAWVLVMMSYDRRRAICYPLDSYSWRGRRCQMMILIAWILSAFCSLPQLFIFAQREYSPVYDPGVLDCWASFIEPWGSKLYVLWFSLSIYLIPLSILFVTYGQVTWTVLKVIRLKENGNLRIRQSGKTSVVDRSRTPLTRPSVQLSDASRMSTRATHSTYRRVYNRTKLLTGIVPHMAVEVGQLCSFWIFLLCFRPVTRAPFRYGAVKHFFTALCVGMTAPNLQKA